MKTLSLSLLMAMALPLSALAQTTTPMSNEEARRIAQLPKYQELSHQRVAAGEELPRTASPLPLVALVGGGALAGALGLRRLAG